MNSLPKERLRQAAAVLIVAAAVLAGLWYTLINSQERRLADLGKRIAAAQQELDKMRKAVAGAKDLEANLNAASETLEAIEAEMASGDLFSWQVNVIKQFKGPHPVDIPQFGQPVEKDAAPLPKFPYRQVSIPIAGTAYFHDLGKFLADFENQFPYARIQNLELEPASAASGAEREKLTFRMDVVTLVKPTL
ncbi:MAG TPA: hypothetical protein VI136_26205 [Verrucomicrobiae bacterium]